MPLNRSVHNAIATIIRPASMVAFGAEVLAFAVTAGEYGWATWRRLDLGRIFWDGLGWYAGVLAFGCLVVGLALSMFRHHHSSGDESWKQTEWCVMLSLMSIVLLFLIPPHQRP